MVIRIKRFLEKIKNYFRKDNVLVIYQMGKVGSSSIEESLEGTGYYIEHIHSFHSPMNYQMYKDFKSIKYHVPFHSRLKRYITGWIKKVVFMKRGKTKVITLVRDPIARNISMFFQDIHVPVFEIGKYLDNRTETDVGTLALQNVFFEKMNHEYGIKWFDKEFKRTFGIDVYDSTFDKEKGFSIYQKNNIEVMVLKLESISKNENEIARFLNINDFSLKSTNRADNKWYASLYEDFKSHFTPSKQYIDNLYNSKYMNFFYTDSEIQQFRSKWNDNN